MGVIFPAGHNDSSSFIAKAPNDVIIILNSICRKYGIKFRLSRTAVKQDYFCHDKPEFNITLSVNKIF